MNLYCRYSLIRFTPDIYSGERANIGVVLIDPVSKTLFFRFIIPTQYSRIKKFFSLNNTKLLNIIISVLKDEYSSYQKVFHTHAIGYDIFQENIVKNNNNLINYSEVRTIACSNAEQALNDIFNRDISPPMDRTITPDEHVKNKVGELLRTHKLNNKFKKKTIGGEIYSIEFPFVNTLEKGKFKVIKPLHFTHKNTKQLIEYGNRWISAINELNIGGYLKGENIMFTYMKPSEEEGTLLNQSFLRVKDHWERKGIYSANISEEDEKIIQFAR